MCGIWALLGEQYDYTHENEFLKIAGRGPDLTVVENVHPNVWFGFHRLAIVQPKNCPSEQPITFENLSVICNGEIYNHEELKARSGIERMLNGASDCAAILHSFAMFDGDISKTCASLDGVFAFVLTDNQQLYIGRDPIGVRPLFYGFTLHGDLLIGSEMKCIEKICETVHAFPPGCCAAIPLSSPVRNINFARYYFIPQIADGIISMESLQVVIRQTLISSVRKRLMGNRQFGFMLSGGLDSSLIAAIACRLLGRNSPVAFSVGFENSPDIANARSVADFLGIEHKVLIVTPEDCIKILPEVVYALETFDPLVIRCGVVHYLLCRYIASTSHVKVLLSGEGADELFGSYAYMQKAPSSSHLHHEILRRLRLLHHYDVLRCDRATSCHGLEIRVPFLDKKFIDLVVRLPPSLKLFPDRLEKYALRSAFSGWLPDDVLWRSKEGFSEALGEYDIGDIVGKHADQLISNDEFARRADIFPSKTPKSKEEFWYRTLFQYSFDYCKVQNAIHTYVYRTAAWHLFEEKDNLCALNDKKLRGKRLRRRSTGSSFINAVA